MNAWLDYEFDLYATPSRVHYLRLLVRLHEDPEVSNEMRLGLHCAQPLVLQGLHSLRPRLAPREVEAAWVLASSSAYAAILESQESLEDFGETADMDVKRATTRFVLAGLAAFLDRVAARS